MKKNTSVVIHPSFIASTFLLLLALYVLQSFVMPFFWALIFCLATWPLHEYLTKRISKTWSAVILTLAMTLLLVVPVVYFSSTLVSEIKGLIQILINLNRTGIEYPPLLQDLPRSSSIETWWINHLGQPNGVGDVLETLFDTRLQNISSLLQTVSAFVLRMGSTIGFSLVFLFFMYLKGANIANEMNRFINNYMGKSWQYCFSLIPKATRGTVDGLVLVGIGVGVLSGVVYAIFGASAPLVLGILTALVSMVPLVPYLFYVLVATWMSLTVSNFDAVMAGIICLCIFVLADNFVKPVLIGNGTKLTFLPVLIGLLGGVSSFGLIGLFIGPVIMVILISWWHSHVDNLVDSA